MYIHLNNIKENIINPLFIYNYGAQLTHRASTETSNFTCIHQCIRYSDIKW